MTSKTLPILLVLVVALVLRVYGLSRGDAMTDEVLYAFRAIGLVDTLLSADQTTPFEWGGPPPSWAHASFHDHPPLVFWVQHLFLRVLGENRVAFRLPSALLGVASVFLLYRIGSLLYSRSVGLLAACILAVTVNHVYISRLGLQEAYVIFFMLLFSWFLVKSVSDRRNLLGMGIALGLALLTKYIAAVVVPIAGVVLATSRPRLLRDGKLWIGCALAALLFSPVLYYNFRLYQTVGHFDFQLSYLLGQDPKVWQVAPGKEMVGDVANRIRRFLPVLIESNSWLLLAAFGGAIAAFLAALARTPRETLRRHALVLISIAFLMLLIVAIGSTYRFLSLLSPMIALSIAVFVQRMTARKAALGSAFVAASFAFFAFFAFEIGYSYNSVIAYDARGAAPFTFAKGPREECFNWGYNELTQYIESELAHRKAEPELPRAHAYLTRLRDLALEEQRRLGYEPYSALIVYDSNLDTIAPMWSLLRWSIYHAWTVQTTDQLSDFMKSNEVEDPLTLGFDHYYLIMPTSNIPLQKAKITDAGARFEADLIRRGIEPIQIRNPRDLVAFNVYKVDKPSNTQDDGRR